jgi:hypothetical protein
MIAVTAASSSDLAAEAAIRLKLDERWDHEARGAPLTDIVDLLRQRGIPAVLDQRALQSQDVTRETPCDVGPAGIRVATALRLALRPHELTWVIWQDVLLITTEDSAETLLQVRVYDVSSLSEDTDRLINTVQRTVAPDTWDDYGGYGSIVALGQHGRRLLVVSQTTDKHEQLEQLLRNLERFAGPGVSGRRSSDQHTIRRSVIPATRYEPASPGTSSAAERPLMPSRESRVGGFF